MRSPYSPKTLSPEDSLPGPMVKPRGSVLLDFLKNVKFNDFDTFLPRQSCCLPEYSIPSSFPPQDGSRELFNEPRPRFGYGGFGVLFGEGGTRVAGQLTLLRYSLMLESRAGHATLRFTNLNTGFVSLLISPTDLYSLLELLIDFRQNRTKTFI